MQLALLKIYHHWSFQQNRFAFSIEKVQFPSNDFYKIVDLWKSTNLEEFTKLILLKIICNYFCTATCGLNYFHKYTMLLNLVMDLVKVDTMDTPTKGYTEKSYKGKTTHSKMISRSNQWLGLFTPTRSQPHSKRIIECSLH